LGIWAQDGRFFVVLIPRNIPILDVVQKIAADELIHLPYQFRETTRPKSGEFESLWGNCPALVIAPQTRTR
jgi:hypothetical protein